MNKKITLMAVLLLLGTYSAIPVYSEEENIQETEIQVIKVDRNTLDKAQEAINNKNFQLALDYLNAYINSKSNKYEAYKLRADAYYELRRYAEAEKDYQKAIEIKTSDDKLMTGTKYISAVVLGADKYEQLQNPELGNLYGRLMYAQKAQNNIAYATAYENAVKYNSHIYLPQPKKEDIAQINCPQKYGKVLSPKGIDAEIYAAIDDIEKEQYSQSIFKIQNITSQYPDYYLGYYLYGVALAGLEKDEEAILAFEKSLYLNPDDFESLASLGQIYYSQAETTFDIKDSKKSIEYFQKALSLNPNCYIYYFYIGLNELQMGNFDLAISNFDKALKINPQDYNSMYYNLIAQYNKGNYSAVVNGAEKLLYRHVSNYNSVLYIRALANNKLGNSEKTLEDLNLIKNNIEDIYNADIKVVTERDKALESYVYYLKSEIENDNSVIKSSDREKAMQNPVIVQLEKAKRALKPYQQSLNAENISMDDYKKFEDFYNSGLVKMLETGIVIPQSDVENQYDYIRTTFDDLGLSFKYLNPDYKLSTISDYPYKKYSSKLSKTDFSDVASQTPEEVKQSVTEKNEYAMKEQTPQIEMVADETKPSLAQILASNQLANRVSASKQSVEINKSEDTEVETKQQEFKAETPDGEKVQTSSNIASGEPFVFIDKANGLVDNNNSKNVKEILEEENNMDNPDLKEGGVKISAKEIKETPDIIIKYDEPQKEEQKTSINEKHANINPEDYGVKPSGIIPEIAPEDEVVELSQKDLIQAIMPELNGKSVETAVDTTVDKVVSSSFDGASQEIKNIKEKLETPPVELPELDTQELAQAVEVPVVVVPELVASTIVEKPQIIREEIIQDETEPDIQSEEQLPKGDENLGVEAPNLSEEEKAVQAKLLSEQEKLVQEKIKAEEKAQKLAIKLQKEEEKAEAKPQKQSQKIQARQEKAEAKAIKEKEKFEAKVQAKELKAQKILEKQAIKDAQKLEREQQRAEILAQKQKVQEEQNVKNAEFKSKLEQLKLENERLKEELQSKKENEKLQAQAAKEQLKQERAQALSEAKARKQAQRLELKEQKQVQKEAKAQTKALKQKEAAEKKVSNSQKKEKFNIKKFFSKAKSSYSEESSEKTIIKSLEK